jgi:hypothetical protein
MAQFSTTERSKAISNSLLIPNPLFKLHSTSSAIYGAKHMSKLLEIGMVTGNSPSGNESPYMSPRG